MHANRCNRTLGEEVNAVTASAVYSSLCSLVANYVKNNLLFIIYYNIYLLYISK